MNKALRASALVLCLVASAYAGDVQTPPVQPVCNPEVEYCPLSCPPRQACTQSAPAPDPLTELYGDVVVWGLTR